MKYFSTFILMGVLSFGESNFVSTQYTSLKHKDKPVNDFVSVYLNLEDTYTFKEGDIDIRLGLNALGVLKKSADFDLFHSIQKNRALIHSLSIDYYPSHDTLLSLGRQSLDINLLRGSFDGLLAVGYWDDLSVKAFYFKRYSILYPSYYKNVKLDKLYGVNVNYDKGIFESEVSLFAYYDHKVENIYMGLHPQNFTLGLEHLGFYSSALADEKALKAHIGYKYKNLYAEVGYYNVYEGSLRNIYALGATEFKTFRLHGFLDQDKAQNVYIDLQYAQENFYAKLHVGTTSFKDTQGKDRRGKELGITLSKVYEQVEFSLSYLTQKSNQVSRDNKRTTWLQTQIKYRF